ncbi:hypothetical protein FPSE_11263, partial [Fusarium pseudograminearum CS3096]
LKSIKRFIKYLNISKSLSIRLNNL